MQLASPKVTFAACSGPLPPLPTVTDQVSLLPLPFVPLCLLRLLHAVCWVPAQRP